MSFPENLCWATIVQHFEDKMQENFQHKLDALTLEQKVNLNP